MIELVKFVKSPVIGKTKSGQEIQLGGFSSLQFLKIENNKIFFLAVTDRGPNAQVIKNGSKSIRPFLLPNYSPQVVEFSYNLNHKILNFENQIALKNTDTKNFSGLPPVSQNSKFEIAVDTYGIPLTTDLFGIDPEGLCLFQDTYLVSEEYGPDLLQFDSEFKLIKRWSPGNGLPVDLAARSKNRGLEGLASNGESVFLMMQSPIEKQNLLDKTNIRIIQFNPSAGVTEKEFYYPVTSESDKIGDLTFVKDNKFLVIEQNGIIGPEEGVRKIYQIDLSLADANGVLRKELVLDLNTLNFHFVEKIEGLTLVDSKTLALLTDNDYGFSGPIDFQSGIADVKKDPCTYMSLITLENPLR